MTVFSFHPVKTVTTGEGGAITLRDPELRERLLDVPLARDDQGPGAARAPGRGRLVHGAAGARLQLPDHRPPVRARAARSWRKLERFVAARNAIAERYREGLAGIDGCGSRRRAPAGARHAYHLFVVEVARAPRASTTRCASAGSSPRSTTCRSTCTRGTGDTYGYAPGLCPAAEAYYARLPVAAVLPGADRGRAGHGHRRGARACSRASPTSGSRPPRRRPSASRPRTRSRCLGAMPKPGRLVVIMSRSSLVPAGRSRVAIRLRRPSGYISSRSSATARPCGRRRARPGPRGSRSPSRAARPARPRTGGRGRSSCGRA